MSTPINSTLPLPRWKTWITISSSIFASVYILAAYSSFTRPIWIDEFLHYTLGSHRSTAEAWLSISETLPTFNHGQTGIHMLVNYWTLHHFGASSFLLRLPSLLAAAFLLVSSVQIALRLRFGPVWTLLLLASFFCQQNMMYYAGEARPYLPLAAAVMGTLAFYLVPRTERSIGLRIWSAFGLWLGVLFHPFFSIYWLMLALLTFAFHQSWLNWRDLVPGFIRHCDPLLSIPAAIAYLVLAKLTWLRGSPDFNMDPFQWIRADGIWTTFIRITHFQFLAQAYAAPLVALGLGVLGCAVPRIRRSPSFHRLVRPLALIAFALAMSLLLSAISYYREYWVLPRQWVASEAVCCLGVIWLAREIGEWARAQWRFLDLPVLGLVFYALLQAMPSIHRAKLPDLEALAQAIVHPVALETNAAIFTPEKIPANNDEWVALANANIKAGGPVWPIFRRFYARKD